MKTPADHSEQLTILVIDDDPDMREMLGRILMRHGHLVVTAPSAEEGLEQLPYYTFHIAYLDQNLPGMDGLVLGEYLRANNPTAMVALVTGDTSTCLERAGARSGIRVIHKPFGNDEILDVVTAYREAARLRAEQEAAHGSTEWAPPVQAYASELAAYFRMPGTPSRIADKLDHAVRQGLNSLRSESRYNERDRVATFAGLLAARVLGVDLPNVAPHTTPWQEYDRIMRARGRRAEFTLTDE